MKKYTSFDQIDRDLKILKLQADIDKEETKITVDKIKDGLSPVSLVGSTVGSVMQKALVFKAVSKVFGLKRVVASTK